MKKLLFLLVILFVIINNVKISAITNFKGGIFSNTTWTKAESPYIIIDTVVIFNDVTLTIEPGVSVKFDNGKCMLIRGTIIAKGNSEDSIIFTSSSTSPTKGIWKGFYFEMSTKAEFNYCVFSFADLLFDLSHAYQGNYNIKGSRFYENNDAINKTGIGTSLPNMTVDSSIFEFNYVGSSQCADIIFKNCIFRNNQIGIEKIYESEIINCTFSYNFQYALGMSAGRIEYNTITNNGLGIKCWLGPNFIFKNNQVTYNDVGIEMWGASTSYNISNNIICNNNIYNVKNQKMDNFNLSNNCWCLSDSASIREKIYDAYNDISFGIINFMPYKDSCSIDSITSIKLNETSEKNILWQIYPNPANNYIELPEALFINNSNALIYSSIGELVYKGSATKRVDISTLSPGIYFLKVKDRIYKFVKM